MEWEELANSCSKLIETETFRKGYATDQLPK